MRNIDQYQHRILIVGSALLYTLIAHIHVVSSFYSYEQLMKEEHTTSQEVSELDKHFDMWAQLPPVSIPDDKPTKKSASQLTNKKSILADMPEEVAAFEVCVSSA